MWSVVKVFKIGIGPSGKLGPTARHPHCYLAQMMRATSTTTTMPTQTFADSSELIGFLNYVKSSISHSFACCTGKQHVRMENVARHTRTIESE